VGGSTRRPSQAARRGGRLPPIIYPPTSGHGPVGWPGVVGWGVSQSSIESAKAAHERATAPPKRPPSHPPPQEGVAKPPEGRCRARRLSKAPGRRRRRRRKALLQGKQAHRPHFSRASKSSRASKRTDHISPGQANAQTELLQGRASNQATSQPATHTHTHTSYRPAQLLTAI
jgi:hypothetical protein